MQDTVLPVGGEDSTPHVLWEQLVVIQEGRVKWEGWGILLRSKGLKGATCIGLLVWWMLVADWKLLVLSVYKGLTPLVPRICGR